MCRWDASVCLHCRRAMQRNANSICRWKCSAVVNPIVGLQRKGCSPPIKMPGRLLRQLRICIGDACTSLIELHQPGSRSFSLSDRCIGR